MEQLKKYFPFSFTEKKDLKAVIVNVLLHIVAGWGVSIVLGIAGLLPVVRWFTGIAGALIELYLFVGIVLSIMDYMKGLK